MTPADTLADTAYRAMCHQPAHVALAARLQRASASQRASLTERVDRQTLGAALAWLASPEALRERDRRLA
ncbi:MAG: hypothetical protein ACREUL_17780 [Steroidobacteraceae bacterium]